MTFSSIYGVKDFFSFHCFNQLSLQDRNDSFFLLNNLLSLNSDLENDSLVLERREQVGDSERLGWTLQNANYQLTTDHNPLSTLQVGREVFNMDWLDNLELKNEQGDGDERSPEKEEERKRKHNQGGAIQLAR